MYKNLNAVALGVSGRQSELIELALTYGYRGFDMDIDRFVKQAQRGSVEHARRFIDSAKNFSSGCAIGGWQVTTDWSTDDQAFANQLSYLTEAAEVAGSIGADLCYTTIQPGHDALPYHENFERHRTRLAQAGEALAKHGVRMGLDFRPAPEARKDKANEFVHDFEGILALCSTVGVANVGLVLDSWNWYVGGGGMDQLQGLTAEQIVIVRLANVPADADMSAIEEDNRIMPDGDGLIDCEAIVKLLVEKGYEGPVSARPAPGKFTGKTRESIVQAAADSLERLWVAAGLSKPKTVPAPVEATADASVNGEAAKPAEAAADAQGGDAKSGDGK